MTLEAQHAAILADIKGKLHRRDWHGVRDACVDLEILEARMLALGCKVPT